MKIKNILLEPLKVAHFLEKCYNPDNQSDSIYGIWDYSYEKLRSEFYEDFANVVNNDIEPEEYSVLSASGSDTIPIIYAKDFYIPLYCLSGFDIVE